MKYTHAFASAMLHNLIAVQLNFNLAYLYFAFQCAYICWFDVFYTAIKLKQRRKKKHRKTERPIDV